MKIEKKKKISKQEAMDKGRRKSQKVKTRVTDVKKMKSGVRDYEEALKSGETAQEYKQRTGFGKSKIFYWRKVIEKRQKKDA